MKKRPIAVVILVVIAIIAGLLAIGDIFRYLGLLPTASFGELKFFGVSWLGAIMAAIVAWIWLQTAARLWALNPRGWLFAVSIALIYLIFDFIAVLGGSTWADMLPSIAVNGIAFVLCLLPGTKEAFGQSAPAEG